MKIFIYLLIVVPFIFASPLQQGRVYVPEEEDPEYKRFIYLENENGTVELVDLLANVQPYLVLASDVSYDLYTQKNKLIRTAITYNDVSKLKNSNFDPNKISLFVVHGWTNNRLSSVNTVIKSAALDNHDINVFIVDWSRPALLDYATSKRNTEGVGKILGEFINLIQSTYGIGGDKFVLAGHSLGAHVVGNAGAIVKDKVGLIVGMDPAGPLFTILNTANRLDPTDGKFVQVIHTNGLQLGFSSSIGHADFYPNNGYSQPGCALLDATGLCSHARAFYYFAESLERGRVFRGYECSSYTSFNLGLCRSNTQSYMGLLTTDGAKGDFYLDVNSRSPYGQG